MKNFNFINQKIRCVSGVNLNLSRYAAMVLVLLTLSFGETWASATYKLQLTSVDQSNTAYGLVYASESNSPEPAISSYYQSKSNPYSALEQGSKDYYLWAIPTQRGVVFNNWTTNSSMSSGASGGSSSLTNASTMQGAKVTVKAPTSANGTSTYTTSATVKANWTKYKKVRVTYGMKNTGTYRVSYKYPEYDSSNKTFTENGGSFFDLASGTQTEDAYHNEEITLSTSAGNFLGWYSDAACTVPLPDDPQSRSYTSNTYTYVVPDEETTKTVYALFDDAITLYGRLNVQWATTSAADGGLMYVSTSEGTAGATFTATPQTVDFTSFVSGTTTADQIYYLYAQNADPMKYVFVGWYNNPDAEGEPLGTEMEYAYTLHGVTSTDAEHPDEGTVYACFSRISSHYLQVDALPGTPGLGMVLTSDKAFATQPDYEWYKNVSSTTVIVNSLDNTTEGTVYLYAQPKYGYEFKGWYDNAAFEGAAVGTTTGIAVQYSVAAASTDPLLPTKKVLYAKFEQTGVIDMVYEPATNGNYIASALDIVDVDGEYVWGYTQLYSSEGKTANTTVKQFKLTGSTLQLNASPNTGKKVKSYKDDSKTVTTISYVYNTTASSGKTMGVTFDTSHPFKVGSTLHDDLQSAINDAASGSNKTIIVVDSAYVPKPTDRDAYEIPSGVTLLVPYDNDYTLKTTKPVVAAQHTDPTLFMKLVLAEGTVIVNKGAICVGATMASPGAGMKPCGGVYGNYGCIIMNKNSRIDVENGANLYCWGFISGPGVSSREKTSGTIHIKSGAKVYEGLQITDFKGGSGTAEMCGAVASWQWSLLQLAKPKMQDYSDKKVFTISNYYLQNVEVPMSLYHGATEYMVTAMYANDQANQTEPVAIIGSNAFFSVDQSDGVVTKSYNGVSDRLEWKVDGNTSINAMSVTLETGITGVGGVTASSANMVLNLTNNMDIIMRSGTCTIKQEMAVVPGATIEVQHGATMKVNKNVFIYDSLEWKKTYMYSSTIRSLAPKYTFGMKCTQRTWNDSKGYANFNDAVVKLNGKCQVDVTGLYTTAHGANIFGTGGGVLELNKLSSSTQTAYQVTKNAASADNPEMTFDQIPITSPQLRNWDDTYTSTSSATAGAKFYNVRGAWVGLTQSGCFYLDWQSHKYVYTDDFIEVVAAPEVYPNAWQSTDCENLIYIHTADNCTWVPTHTVEETTSVLKGMDDKYWQYSTSKGYWEEAPSHKVTFKNFNGKILEEGTIYHTGTPTYNGYTPVRPTDDNGTYTFTGWDQAFAPVTADVEYTAQYSCAPHEASVTAYALTTYYPTVGEAITAANGKTDAVVTILQNASTASEIAITKTMTIDLNGKTISATQASATGVFNINASGKTITIKDSGTGGKIDHTANYSGGYLYGINMAAGSLSIESGTIYAKNNAANRAFGIYTDGNGSATGITISGSAIVKAESSTSPYGIYSFKEGCTLTMNGGTVIANGGGSRGIYMKGETNLTNATITVTGSGAYTIFAVSGDMTINSGTYKTSDANDNFCIYHRNNAITIKGGYFSTSNKLYTRQNGYSGTITLQGGYYNNGTELEEKCATNYHVLPNADANYPYKVAEAYTVTFMDGDNNPIQSSPVEKNTTPVYSGADPTKTPTAEYTYSFNGTWSPAISAVTAAATYTAQFDNHPRSYTLTWDLNEGTVKTAGTANGLVEYGTSLTAPVVTKTGYTFANWTPTQPTTMPAANTTYTATWTPTNCDISYNLNGGSVTPANANPTSYTIESNDITLTNPTKEHYTFAGWTGSNGSTPQETVTIASGSTGDKSYTANWNPVNYNISYDLNGGSATNPTTYNIETATFALTNPTKSGYTFKGWTGSNGSTPEKTVTIAQGSTGEKAYTAEWIVNYTITWMDGSDVKLVQEWPEGSIPSYAYQKPQTAQYTYVLTGWSDENQTKYLFPETLPAVTRNATYTAQYDATARSYTIQFVNDNNAVLQSSTLQYGATPAYKGTPASSNKDERITRTFIGWSPSIVDVVGPATYKAQYRSDITAADNTTATITISEPVDNVVTTTVETTGKLDIQSSGSLTTNTLILQATVGGVTSGESGEITGANHITNNANTDVYFDLTLNTWARHWHAFGVPWSIGSLFDTKLIEIKDKQGNDCHKELTLGRDYDIIYYNGATRAAQGAGRHCWDYVEDGDGTLTPGKAYMIGFIKPTGTVRFQKAAGAAITSDANLEVPYYTGSKTKDEGWNAIANPKTYHTSMDADVTWCFVHNGDTMKSDGFTTRKMTDMEFVVGTAVFVQANPEKSVVTINPYSSSAAAPRRDAVRRNASQYYEVDIKANGKFADCIYVKADEDKEADVYTNDLDVAKMGVSSVRAQMWVDRYDAQLAVNTVAPRNNSATYPLGIFVPQAGEYTITIGNQGDEESMLYLTYNGRAIWNLSYGEYTGSFEQGTTNLYGLRIVYTSADKPTDIDEATIENGEAVRKVIIDDKVYIIRNGEIYSITGQKAQ